MPERLVIFGADSQAKLAHYYFTGDSDFEVVAFTVDRDYLRDDTFCGLPVVAFDDIRSQYSPDDHAMFVAIGYTGMNRLRAEKYEQAKQLGYRLPSYVSSRCSFLTDNPPGDNCLILEDNTVQPFVTIGNNVTLWSGNHIGHDVWIGDHAFVTSHVVVSGFTRIGPYSFLGVNATLRDDITIGASSLIGAGAVIMKDTEPYSVYVPPRPTKVSARSDEVDI